MLILIPLYLSFALLLGMAGLSKVRFPDQAVLAARVNGIPVSRGFVKLFGGYELVLAAAAVLASNHQADVIAVGVCGTYAFFVLFTLRLVHSGKEVSCGCFGGSDARASWAHVVTTGFGVLVASGVAVVGQRLSIAEIVVDLPVRGLPVAVAAVSIAGLVPAILRSGPSIVTQSRSRDALASVHQGDDS